MCGIVGYAGSQTCAPLLLEALRHLEYRGYDSAGIAVVAPTGDLQVRKAAGKIQQLADLLAADSPGGSVGIGHTRWATHGRPSDENAHPHTDCTGRVCVVHNGVVENYADLRTELAAEGHRLVSETDTEVLAHLIEAELDRQRVPGNHTERQGEKRGGPNLLEACRRALARVDGLYAIAAVCLDEPEVVVGARSRAPLIVGLGRGENFLASDLPAVLEHTTRVVRLHEGDLVEIRPRRVLVIDRNGERQERPSEAIDLTRVSAEKEGYPHFFLKEVFEQPDALERTISGRAGTQGVHLPEMDELDVKRIRRLVLTGCGSAHHACLMARYALESWLHLPIEVEIGSELRYREVAIDGSVLCIGVSQSGETADTLAASELCRDRGAQVVAVTNVVGSAITFVADHVLYQHSGPEVAVVSSKSFTGQLAALLLLGVDLGTRMGRMDTDEAQAISRALLQLPPLMRDALGVDQQAARIAELHSNVDRLLFLGRGVGYPTALEGALKLKEISYIQAEGYAAGELKHGPLALVEEGTLVVVVATRSATLDKLIANVEEVRARGGRIMAIATEGDERIAAHAEEIIYVPETPELLSPIVNVVPMQLLAYYAAVARGCDVDKPRNLAKSVTVE